MLLFLPSIVIYLGTIANGRRILCSVKFWVAGIVAILVFVPNILWNLYNGMVSFSHTGDNAKGAGLALHPGNMLEFIGAQFGVFGPILFAVLLLIFCRIKSNITYKEERFLACQILPLFVLICAISLLSRAHANWAAPIYVPATILVVSWLIDARKKKLLIISLALHIFVAALFMGFLYIKKIPGITLSGVKTDLKSGVIKDPFLRLAGWRDLGDAVSRMLVAYPGATLMTDSRKIHAELLYYVYPHPVTAVKWNPTGKIGDHYDLTSNMNSYKEKDLLFVTLREIIDVDISTYFESAERVGNIEINPHGDRAVNYFVYYLKGFKGYEKE
jgi:4-amino-4-deoxy-L-arabinose transferase-like glycosyltransferase